MPSTINTGTFTPLTASSPGSSRSVSLDLDDFQGNYSESLSPSPALVASPKSLVGSPKPSADSPDATEDTVKSESGKKPTKKRKGWGQVLPTPTTNLPPRKRAKTEAEKEQRRIERVLRNRAAAQTSRERKRQEAEALEDRNKELAAKVAEFESQNQELLGHVANLERQLFKQEREIRQLKEGDPQQNPTPPSEPMLAFTEQPNIRFISQSTLNPSLDLLSPTHPVVNDPSMNTDDALCMTHQSAVLMCSPEDLQCLQRASRSSTRSPSMDKMTIWAIQYSTPMISLISSLKHSQTPLLSLDLIRSEMAQKTIRA